jgi:hypothetical protein
MITITVVKQNERAMNKAMTAREEDLIVGETRSAGVWLVCTAEIYTVRFVELRGTVFVVCDCPAGSQNNPRVCYHAAAAVIVREHKEAQQTPQPEETAAPRPAAAQYGSRISDLRHRAMIARSGDADQLHEILIDLLDVVAGIEATGRA